MGGSIDGPTGAIPGARRSDTETPALPQSGPRRWLLLRRAGDIARDHRQWRAAARCYQWYLRLNPRDTAIWVQLGHTLKEAARPAEAADAYARALRIDASDLDLLPHYGRLCQLLGRLDTDIPYPPGTPQDDDAHSSEARPDLGSRATESPADRALSAQLAAGDAAREGRAWRLAAEHYRAYLRLNPTALPIWVQFSHMLKESEQFAEATRAYDTARRLDPDDADLLLRLAELSKLTSERP